MEPIVIISGKGGTGKTTLAASFASLAENNVITDCDVGAPDRHRHLLLKPKVREKHEFTGLKVAWVPGVPVVEFPGGAVSGAIEKIWRRTNEDHNSL